MSTPVVVPYKIVKIVGQFPFFPQKNHMNLMIWPASLILQIHRDVIIVMWFGHRDRDLIANHWENSIKKDITFSVNAASSIKTTDITAVGDEWCACTEPCCHRAKAFSIISAWGISIRRATSSISPIRHRQMKSHSSNRQIVLLLSDTPLQNPWILRNSLWKLREIADRKV